eukprot:m.852554 g.852554  ORF g.852554 m.852554 type:complete len:97 (-) comp23496_c0_seq17:1424-1714(-)
MPLSMLAVQSQPFSWWWRWEVVCNTLSLFDEHRLGHSIVCSHCLQTVRYKWGSVAQPQVRGRIPAVAVVTKVTPVLEPQLCEIIPFRTRAPRNHIS